MTLASVPLQALADVGVPNALTTLVVIVVALFLVRLLLKVALKVALLVAFVVGLVWLFGNLPPLPFL